VLERGHMEEKLQYAALSGELQERIRQDRENHWENPWQCREEAALRRDMERDKATLWRPAFVRDSEKIMHLPLYNRYADKTQVFSFYENDDLTRRALHVQLVSRIARNIGAVLGLNLDLIEAIALGHDLGHTPFGHAGERYLSELLEEHTGRYFNHNVHSVRVLEGIFHRNVTLQTLDGILCHNGEFAQKEYRPQPLAGFAPFDESLEACCIRGEEAVKTLVPGTLEGCVVRVCDMIAYLGKDRQDAVTARIISEDTPFTTQAIGAQNAAIINNMTVDILENSYGRDCLLLSPQTYQDLKTAKAENYEKIYRNEKLNEAYETSVRPMFREIFEKLLGDLQKGQKASPVFQHHISFVQEKVKWYGGPDYREEDPCQIVTDYIASMTDDYFLALHHFLFPKSSLGIRYHSYFADLQ
jgi:dGTPase